MTVFKDPKKRIFLGRFEGEELFFYEIIQTLSLGSFK